MEVLAGLLAGIILTHWLSKKELKIRVVHEQVYPPLTELDDVKVEDHKEEQFQEELARIQSMIGGAFGNE